MKQKAIAVVDQIRAVDKSRFLAYVGSMDDEAMAKIEEGLRLVLGL
ncbi:type II toxin-antitoxin system PemK/MazF family toxin [bacterium]|nr:type II toxin-antitoxin system PemK/MazF family toxin [bacterium]